MALCIFNSLRNFMLHEIVICGDKDPPCFKEENMSINATKIALFKNYRNNIRNINLIRLFSK